MKTSHPKVERVFGAGAGQALDRLASEVADARAVRIDMKAITLLQGYMNEVPQDQFKAIVKQMRLPWSEMWLELEAPSATSMIPAVLLIQDDALIRARIFTSTQHNPIMPFKPPFVEIRLDTPTCAFTVALTEFGDLASRYQILAAYEARKEDEERLTQMIPMIAGLSAVMAAGQVLKVREEEPPSRIMRQRLKKDGRPVPRSAVTRIDLSELGLRDYRARHESAPEEAGYEGKGIAGKRRAHHVQGHMFMARNGILTFRRPHKRGEGELIENPVLITASGKLPPEPHMG